MFRAQSGLGGATRLKKVFRATPPVRVVSGGFLMFPGRRRYQVKKGFSGHSPSPGCFRGFLDDSGGFLEPMQRARRTVRPRPREHEPPTPFHPGSTPGAFISTPVRDWVRDSSVISAVSTNSTVSTHFRGFYDCLDFHSFPPISAVPTISAPAKASRRYHERLRPKQHFFFAICRRGGRSATTAAK